jgi:hypothetical protein
MRSPTAFRSAAWLRFPALGAAVAALVLATVRVAAAGACGDSVDGARVACACGDVVVTDTVLWPTDPVATEPCADDGLTIVAPRDVDSITLNLGGQSIVGRGYGTGIRVVRGGRLGAVIIGGDQGDARAEIARFATGIRASGRDVLREVRSVDVHDNIRDGVSVRASGVTIDDVRSENNGRDGLAIGGHGNEVTGVTATNNSRDGLKVRGSAATLEAETTGNARNGAAIGGRGHQVQQLRTTENGGAGVATSGNGHDLGATQSAGNAGGSVSSRAGAGE